MKPIRGVLTAMATPFGADGAVDLAGARRLAAHLIDHGSHGLVIAGTTGESPTLSDDEKLALLREVKEELGDDASLILGTGSNDTRHSVQLTERAAEAGADAALVVTPYYNKPNFEGLLAHYAEVDAVGLPIVLYNIPSRVVVNIDPQGLAEIGRLENVVAVKQANDDELGPVEGIDVLAGNDSVFLRTLEFGGAGGILVATHLVGAQMREIWNAFAEGDHGRARRIDAALAPVYAAVSVTNPITVKAGLGMLGIIDERMRLPLVPAGEPERAAVRAALEDAGVLARAG
ncbi:MAG TPA: 4-hydroxy-tetrahydrodipicolinate synthase [Solirubrobacterales bacterium]|nr:4-hydroxy-tetrahydrodipicolinate synthase [Solirubrobacterales bacterium]